ncbi:MAG: hypothetical protein ACFCA4_08130 [Cyanophyceae cyanobacterium]
MIFPSWYVDILDQDVRGSTRSNDDYVREIVGAIDVVIEAAIARNQSISEVRAAVLSDDQLLTEDRRAWLSQVVDMAWAAHAKNQQPPLNPVPAPAGTIAIDLSDTSLPPSAA